MTNTLKKLEAEGLVKIEPDELSGRKKKVTITLKGEELHKQAIAASAPMFQEFAERFQAEDIASEFLNRAGLSAPVRTIVLLGIVWSTRPYLPWYLCRV